MSTEVGAKINHPRSYSFQLTDRTPKLVVTELFARLQQDYPDTHNVNYIPARMRDGTSYPPSIDDWTWFPPDSGVPYKPITVILDWHGLLSELVFQEKALMLDGSMRYWNWNLEDRGSLKLRNNKLEFSESYGDRNGQLSVRLEGFLPSLTKYEPDPETFEPTRVDVDLTGSHPGPLVRSALGYLNEIAPREVSRYGFYIP